MSKPKKPAVEESTQEAVPEAVLEAVVYLGPAIPRLISHGTVFSDGKIPAYMDDRIKKTPAIKGLFVPVSQYAKAAQELKRPGRLKTLYDKVKEA